VKAVVVKSVIIPALSSQWVNISARVPSNESLFEKNSNFEYKTGLLLANAFVKIRRTRTCIQMINPTDKPIRVYSRTVVGTLQYGEPVLVTSNKLDESEPERIAKIGDSLDENQIMNLENLLQEFKDCFASSLADLSITDVVTHHIDTGNAPPLHANPYRVSNAERIEMQNQIDQMLKAGIITESSSPWSS